jgi:predicted RND superfamily exporter protein
MEKFIDILLRKRFIVIGIVAVITLFFVYSIVTKFSYVVHLGELAPPNHPYTKLSNRFVETFGGGNAFVIAVVVKEGDIFNKETLNKIKDINDSLFFRTDEVWRSSIVSIAQRKIKVVKGLPGGLDVSAVMWPEVPKDMVGINRLKTNIFTNELLNGVLVSEDGKAALIFGEVRPEADTNSFFTYLLNMKKEKEDANTSIHMAGLPVLYGWLFKFLPAVKIVLWITIVFCVAILISLFGKRAHGLIVPMLVGLLSTIWGFGFIASLGVNLSPLMIVLPFVVGTRALSHSVQLTRRFLDEYYEHENMETAARFTIKGLFLPSLCAIVTDAVGFLILIVVKIPAVQRLSYMCAFWVMAIFALVSIFGPIISIYLPAPRKLSEGGSLLKKSFVTNFLNTHIHRPLAAWVTTNTKWVILFIWCWILVISGFMSTKMVTGDIHPGSALLMPDSVYNKDCAKINETFTNAGTDTLNVVIEGPEFTMETPKVLRTIKKFEEEIKAALPEIVGGSQSLVPICEKLSMELHEGDPKWKQIPPTAEGVGQLFYMYRTSGDPFDFDRFSDEKYRYGNIVVFLKNHTSETLNKVLAFCENFRTNNPIEGVEFKLAGGTGGMLAAINDEIKSTDRIVVPAIVLCIFIFCSISFGSAVAGILLIIPLVIALLATYGLMAAIGIGMDVNILPVVGVGLGIGIDYGIYLLMRIKEEVEKGNDLYQSIHISLTTAGNGVLFTAITLVVPLLLWYFISSIRFQAEMGLLLAVIMFVNALGAIYLLPALVSIFKPKFLKGISARVLIAKSFTSKDKEEK